jgi:ribosomal protein S18 acetylase RimI-like enzyme
MTEIRDATGSPDDIRLLREMSYLAINWRDPRLDAVQPAAVDDLLARPELRVYVEGWPRPGDHAVIAEDADAAVGAAWYRLFTEAARGYGFIDEGTPEVGVAVRASYRRRGIGAALLAVLIDHARTERRTALSLSVEHDNPAAALYRRLGFAIAGDDGGAWTMRLALAG